MAFKNMTVEEFNQELASDKATPGGGSVAALSAALSSGLLAMVVELTKDNDELKKLLLDFKGDMQTALALIDKDSDSFDLVMQAFKMPKDTEKEVEKRKAAIQEGLKEASLTPLETMELSFKLLEIAKTVAEGGNKNAVTDAGVAGYMAYSAVNGAYFNVIINLASIKDEKFVQETKSKTEKMVNKSDELLKAVKNVVLDSI